MKLMLTSCGLESPHLMAEFLTLLPCTPQAARALFIPAAAVSCDAIEVLPKCLTDLYAAGIDKEHIVINDLHIPLTPAQLSCYDCVYIAGGDTFYLTQRLTEGSSEALSAYLTAGRGVVLGVSAGAMVFSRHIAAHLGVLPNELHVHSAHGTPNGALPSAGQPIFLTNTQGIVYSGAAEPRILS